MASVHSIESSPGLSKSGKENPRRQAWPHERLKKMKTRNPKKKQNALLESITSMTALPENNKKLMQEEDNLRIENPSTSDMKSCQPKLSSYGKDKEKIQPHNPPSNTERNNKKCALKQNTVNTEHNVKRESRASSTKKQGLAVDTLQSSRSASSADSKSKVISKKPPTKPLHLGM